MKIQKRKNSAERRILIAMIVDTTVVGHIAAKWEKGGLFNSTWSNLVGGWCCSYYERHNKAPGKMIEGLFESWATDNKDEETIQLVERFLEGLSGEYAQLRKESNTDYILELSSSLFNKVRITKLAEALQADAETGEIEKAYKRVETYNRVEVGEQAGIDVLGDKLSIKQAFEQKHLPLIRYRGAAGNFFGESLERDGFVSFMGPEKRGKSWMLMDIAWRGMEQGNRVAFFAIGDMSKNQMLLRFHTRASKRPLNATDEDDPKKGPTKYPTSIEYDPGSSMANVEHETRKYKKPLSWQEAWRNSQAVIKKRGGGLLKLSCHSNGSIGVQGIAGIIRSWERTGWVPDVVVLDYADLLAPPYGVTESRDVINHNWKHLRKLSQDLHGLVVTATQSDAASYETEILSMKNFSDDKRKFAHVTGMIGLNQTTAEKKLDLMRLNWLVLRESSFSEDQVLHIAGCRDIANPLILSTF